ncbi:MAG: TonB-dependent receptor [Acidobacteriota bacterium]
MVDCVRRGVMSVLCLLAIAVPAMAQQRGSISGRVLDSDGLALPGATVTVSEQTTNFSRTVVTASTGAFQVPQLERGTYALSVEMPGFNTFKQAGLVMTAGKELVYDVKLQVAGVKESVTVTGEVPLVERTSNRIGGSLSAKDIDEVPSNFRNFTALTQLVPGMTPNPAQSSFEGGQVVANGTPAISNLYLLDGMYNNDDRLGGSQGTQVRVVLDNIEEYQVLSNQYSAEYGGGAGAIINMVTVGGANKFSGRAYNYYRSDKFNAPNYFIKQAGTMQPHELTFQTGGAIGGPIKKDRAFFYVTIERDKEETGGLKKFPAAAAPLAVDQVGYFQVLAVNYFARVDVRLNDKNFASFRWILEKAPTKGENFNVNTAAPDARSWESDWDHLWGLTFTSVLNDRASNVVRASRITEDLGTGQQAFFATQSKCPLTLFAECVSWVGFDGKDPFTMGQQNVHPSYLTGKGGSGLDSRILTLAVDDSFSYFVPKLFGGEHTFKFGGGISLNSMPQRAAANTGVFTFKGDAPFNPNDSTTYPYQFDIQMGDPAEKFGWTLTPKDHRFNLFVEDKWRASDRVTLNLGLRFDHQSVTPSDKRAFAPRTGFAWDVTGKGTTVVRGGIGRFYAYMPISVLLNLQASAVHSLMPTLTITDLNSAVLKPIMITDSAGNAGVASLSPAGIAELTASRAAIMNGSAFSKQPYLDSPGRKLPYQDSWNVGVSQEIGHVAAVTLDYVGNRSKDQIGLIDINEPVNGVRPGVAVFDPASALIPADARGTVFGRVLQYQSNPAFDGGYKSLQVSVIKRMANRWSGRLAYTLQSATYTGIGAPDARRVWLDNDPTVDHGNFTGNRKQVLAMSGSVNPWKTLNIAFVVSAISGSLINETVGTDVNKDGDATDRPIAGINDLTLPIVSALDSQGRAVINGITGPGSVGVDVSFRYQIPMKKLLQSVDLYYDVFNIMNRVNFSNPSGVRTSALFNKFVAAGFPRQMQFGVRVRF